MTIIKSIKEDLINLKQIINPNNLENFFANLRIYPTNRMAAYNLILGLFTFSGYFFGIRYYAPITYSFETSFKVALLYYLGAVSIPLTLGYLLHLFSGKLIHKSVGVREGITIASYSVSIGLIGGIFRIFTETWILQIILIVYSIYAFYMAIKTRFGFENAISSFLFLLISTSIVVMIILKIIAIIMGIQNF